VTIAIERLKQIAAQIHSYSDMSGSATATDAIGTVGRLFDEAMTLGAFATDEHADLRNHIQEAKNEADGYCPNAWPQRVFNALANYYAPFLFAQQDGECLACGPIASVLTEEIKRMETPSGNRIPTQTSLASETTPSEGKGGAARRSRTRNRNADPKAKEKRAARQEQQKADKRLSEAWAGGYGEYETKADLAREKGINEQDVKNALERHRKRLERARKTRPKETPQ